MSEDESLYKTIEEMLKKYNKSLTKNLRKYKITETYGLFIALTFVLALSFGYLSAYYLVEEYNLSFALMFVIFTFIFSVVALAIISYVLVHLYGQSYNNVNSTKTILSYQILNILISIIMSFIYSYNMPIYGGYIIFLILGFVHPISGYLYADKATLKEIEKTITKTYTLITIIFTIINIILKLINLF